MPNIPLQTATQKPYISKDRLKRCKWRKGSLQEDNLPFSGDGSIPADIMALETPFQFFKYLFRDDLFEHIKNETNIYAREKNPNTTFSVTIDLLKKYVGICILSSIIHLPRVRDYWKPTIGVEVIQKSMSVNTFEEIKKYLHFNQNVLYDPNDENRDRLFKIRPVIEHFLANFQKLPADEMLSLDEQLCSTKCTSYLKQYLPLKPKKWGYKFFVLSSVDGYVHNFELYTGMTLPLLPGEPELGATGNVVVRLCRILTERNYKLYYDNYYTSMPLAVYLYKKNIHTVGTLNKVRIPNIPFTETKKMEKNDRGYYEEFVTSVRGVPIGILSWKDNKVVSFLSTFVGAPPVSTIQRFDRKTRQHLDVPCPEIVKVYNRHMGGVDLMDANLARYKIIFKSRKWYIRIFFHLLDMLLANSWILWKRVKEAKGERAQLTLANFKEEVGFTLCNLGLKSPARGRKPLNLENIIQTKKRRSATAVPSKDLRLDGMGHWPIVAQRNRCRHPNCKDRTVIKCQKCNIFLCLQKNRNCFLTYHTT